MFVSTQEAIKIYARVCRAWYGPRARSVVRSKIQEMKAKGDLSGEKVWRELGDILEADDLDETPRTPTAF
jgi:hypothetical protein